MVIARHHSYRTGCLRTPEGPRSCLRPVTEHKWRACGMTARRDPLPVASTRQSLSTVMTYYGPARLKNLHTYLTFR